MSFYSYKNANPNCCPGTISGSALDGLQEKVCVQVKRVYDSAMTQEQLTKQTVTITSYAQVNNTCTCNACGCQETQETIPPTSAPVPPITFESCRSTTTEGNIRNLTVDRLCDRPCFARVRATIDIPIDILFVDSRCVEYIGKATISVNRDVLLSIPDESIVPYTLESMVSAICVSGTYLGQDDHLRHDDFEGTRGSRNLDSQLRLLPDSARRGVRGKRLRRVLRPAALPAAIRLQQRHGRDGQRQQHGAFQLQLRTRMLRLVQRQLQLRQQQQLIRFPDSPAPSVRVIWESLNEKSRIRVKPGAVFIMILLLLRSRFYPSSNEAGSGASSLTAD